MTKKYDGKLALAMMIGAIGGMVPNVNKGFNGNKDLSKGKMDVDDLEKSAREILSYGDDD